MTHWLSINVFPYAIHAAAGTLSVALVGACVIAPFRKAWFKFRRAIDSLDPQTDTGVTRQLSQIHHELQRPKEVRVHR